MAGSIRILKGGDILFRTGDKAECMYIVRKGSLKVYFMQGNDEVQLAILTDGAIVGEMAFFDQKPRSAHVKALAQTEVMEISRADFDKLLTQIPKWLVTMMQSLSGRLRTANEKIAEMDKLKQGVGVSNDYPFSPLLRSLRLLQLLTLQLGQKETLSIVLDFQQTLDWWMQLTGWPRDYFVKFIDELQKQGMLQKRGDGSAKIYLTGRARLQAFTDFLVEIQPRVSHASFAEFSSLWIDMLDAAINEASQSNYESYNVPILKLQNPKAFAVKDLPTKIKIAETLAHWLALKHTKSNVDFLLKVNPKENKNHAALLRVLHSFATEKLDRIE